MAWESYDDTNASVAVSSSSVHYLCMVVMATAAAKIVGMTNESPHLRLQCKSYNKVTGTFEEFYLDLRGNE